MQSLLYKIYSKACIDQTPEKKTQNAISLGHSKARILLDISIPTYIFIDIFACLLYLYLPDLVQCTMGYKWVKKYSICGINFSRLPVE